MLQYNINYDIFWICKGGIKLFSYSPLWKKLIDLNINKTQLAEKTNITRATIAKMSKNKYVDMSTLDKICNELNCDIQDIVEHIKN